ncbi:MULTISPECIES: AAA family ATPase [unclassified Nitratiruptor]|uniref:AAA family ATPase n=1 Tax=unclassified Nitratiruptor TaxID=2624044 RepID=UPI0019158B56|nr:MULTISPECIES: AAA family ATPase [unclassified Nitratiruptor]BCD59484.1 anticodon nuclease [Nitratiruptor sp. YY08-10]BCD63408.1 anticodon nuclease [Nitratiruptor sp. YY08-14]
MVLFLALFEIEDFQENQNQYFFIDDPISSLDDNNIFITALSIMNLIKNYSSNRKIIITTHHIGFFSIIANWLTKGEKSNKYRELIEIYILGKQTDGELFLEKPKNAIFLYHLHLLKVLNEAKNENRLVAYHFVLLRQLLENIASFLGTGRFSYVLEKIGITDANDISNRLNVLSHKNIFTYESEIITSDSKHLIIEILDKLQDKFEFNI